MINWQCNKSRIFAMSLGMSFVLAISLAGCGTLETPVMHEATATPLIEKADASVEKAQPTAPPTNTPVPPTNTPMPEPTETPTPVPTATPEPTAVPMMSPIDRMVSVRNAEKGAVLFETFQDAANYACSNCHLPTSEKTNIGPGLLNIKDRAITRVDGLSAAEYIYKSIIEPTVYTVDGFEVDLMPQNWAEIYSDLEIFDIVAYLLTLEGESDIDDPDPEEAESEAESG